MGVEFIRKAAPSFRKGLDRRRLQLATPTFFTQQPISAPRTYAATLRTGKRVTVGEKVGVRLDGQRVVALHGLDPVAVFESPPKELVTALQASHGEACGTVHEVYTAAETAEISIC